MARQVVRTNALAQYVELTALCDELCACIEPLLRDWFDFRPLDVERVVALRDEWFEAATSARELAMQIWPGCTWMFPRAIPHQIEAARVALRYS